jgi:hypothetical protein
MGLEAACVRLFGAIVRKPETELEQAIQTGKFIISSNFGKTEGLLDACQEAERLCQEQDVETGQEQDVETGQEQDVETGQEQDVETGQEQDVEMGQEQDVEMYQEQDVETADAGALSGGD